MDLAAGALEDDAEHAALQRQLFEDLAVLVLQRRAVERQQRLPAQLRRDRGGLIVRLLGELVGHLEEEQQGELLDVLEAAEAGVLQDAGVAPGAFADLGGVHLLGVPPAIRRTSRL